MNNNRIYPVLFLFILLFFLFSPKLNAQPLPVAMITVKAGDHLRINTPVSIPADNLPINEGDPLFLKLTNDISDNEIP